MINLKELPAEEPVEETPEETPVDEGTEEAPADLNVNISEEITSEEAIS